jgi:hypothetical protein
MELGTMALRSEVIQCVIFNQVNFEVEMYVSCIIMFVRVRVSKTSSDLMDLVKGNIDVEFRSNNSPTLSSDTPIIAVSLNFLVVLYAVGTPSLCY